VSFDYAARFVMTAKRDVELSKGDRLQMKFNGKSIEGTPISNGELVTVLRVFKDGCIAVRDDAGKSKTLSPSQRLFVPGYAVTSYASQGKTVDVVLAAYTGDENIPITANRNQWYVTISRARRKALVFTEDKAALRTCVDRLGERAPALSVKPSTDEAIEASKSFSADTKELLKSWTRYQSRNTAVGRWAEASQADTAQQVQQPAHTQAAQVRPAAAITPPLPPIFCPQHQPINKGIRI
jgi:hypothetical protein